LGPLGDLPLPCKRKLGADTTALTAHGPPDFLKILGGAAANLDFVRLANDAAPIFLEMAGNGPPSRFATPA